MKNKRVKGLALILTAVLLISSIMIPVHADTGWTVGSTTCIYWASSESSDATDTVLAEQIRLFDAELAEKVTGSALEIVYGEQSRAGSEDIILVLTSTATDIPAQGYEIKIEKDQLTIRAKDADGLFYGCREVIHQLLINGSVTNKTDAPDTPERGVMLDIGRKYYSVDFIKNLILEMSWANMNALTLHFSEEMGLGLESKLFPWLAGRDGTLCVAAEIATDSRYITQDELKEIVAFAHKYHVEIIPSFDSPGHMNYIVKKFNEKAAEGAFTFVSEGETWTVPQGADIGNYFHYNETTAIVQGSRNTAYSRGIDISNEIAVAFTRSLVAEYAELFKSLGCTSFDIGGDELLGWGTAITDSVSKWKQLDHWKTYAQNRAKAEGLTNYKYAVAYDGFLYYMNDLYSLLASKGYTSVRMWNDDALRSSDTGWSKVVTLNTNIQILYWTPSANSGKNTVNTYLNAGYSVFNFLNAFNYFVLKSGYDNSGSEAANVYENWNPGCFTADGAQAVAAGNEKLLGSSFCVWCDKPDYMTEDEVMDNILPRIRAHAAKAWDFHANETVKYATFLSNQDKLGKAPTGESVSTPENIFIFPDMTELEKAVAEYESMDPAGYEASSFAAYTAAANKAHTVMSASRPTQMQVDEALNALLVAKSELRIAETERETIPVTEPETERETIPVTGPETEPDTGREPEKDTGWLTEPETGWNTEPETEPETGWNTEPETGWNTEPETDLVSVSVKAKNVKKGCYATVSVTRNEGVEVDYYVVYDFMTDTYMTITKQTELAPNPKKPGVRTTYLYFVPEGSGEREYLVYAMLSDGRYSQEAFTVTINIRN